MQLTRPTATTRLLAAGCLALAAAVTAVFAASATAAQGLFSPAIVVNDTVISRFDVEQRTRFLSLLNTPGDAEATAREQLVDESLQLAEAARLDRLPEAEAVESGMAEFAARGDLTTEEFVALLAEQGIDAATFERFVRAGVAWRGVVRARFGGRARPSEAAVDRAIAGAGATSNLRVLLSEIVLPVPPGQAQAAQAEAERLSEITSVEAFSQAARALSASPSARDGGRLDWQPITRYPPQLRPALLSLAPGEVTDPLPLEGAVALLQLRAIDETAYEAPEVAEIDYATYLIPGGRDAAARAEARRIRTQVDRCDDLYGVAKGEPPERLVRESTPPEALPQDVALELAKLDAGEVSTALTRTGPDGAPALMFLMLCQRTPAAVVDTPRDDVARALLNRRLESLAEGYLQQLRANARIVEP
mgnify:FL=1